MLQMLKEQMLNAKWLTKMQILNEMLNAKWDAK
jgi:hypothetical protein